MSSPLTTCLRVLSFRFQSEDLAFDRRLLGFGLAFTWLAGIGRYWDHPDPHLLQRLGIGSVVYVFALAALLWIVLAPLKTGRLSFLSLLTLITLSSPPALLYAIPVERFVELETAQDINVWFLGIVATWRVAIFLRYLRVCLRLSIDRVIVAGFLPLCGIVFALTALNLEQAVFEVMAGLESPPGTPADGAYEVLMLLSMLSVLLAPILLLIYLTYLVTDGVKLRRRAREAQAATDPEPKNSLDPS